jgi:branched-chain amino acid transport system substrate-binding protein
MGIRNARVRGVRRGPAICVAAGLALVASACGGDDDDASPEATSAPAATAAPAASAAAGATAAPDSTGGSDAPVVGLSETSINIGVSLPASGPAWEQVKKPFTNGFETWAEDVNTVGGVYGRRVNLVKLDNLFTTEGGVAACKEAQDGEMFMVIAFSSGPEEVDCLDNAGIPVLWMAPTAMDPDWHSVVAGLYYPALAQVSVSFWQSEYFDPPVTKVGIACQCFNPQGEAAAAAYAEEAARQGIETVTVEYEQSENSFVGLVTQMKDAGVDLVLLGGFAENASIIRAADAIDFHPQWTASAAAGVTLDPIAKASGGLFEGMHSLMYMASSDTPAFQEFAEKVRTYHGDDAALGADNFDLVNYGFAVVVGEMLEQAGPDLTHESFTSTMKSIDNFDSGYLAPFSTLGEDVPIGIDSLFPAECCTPEGTFRVLGPAVSEF